MTALRALLFLAGSALAFAANSPALLRHEFIYEKASYPSCHASTIVETASGGLVSAWFGGTAEKNPDVGIWVSHFDAARGAWTPGVEVANGVQADGTRHPTWNPVLFQPRGGAPLMLFYKVGPSPQTWWGELRTSTDGGKTWSAARRLPNGIYGPIKNKPVQLDDGTILCPTSIESPKSLTSNDTAELVQSVLAGLLLVGVLTLVYAKYVTGRWRAAHWAFALVTWLAAVSPVLWRVNKSWLHRGAVWCVYFERTTDGGRTWSKTPYLNDGLTLSAIQPSILFKDQIGGEKLQALGRSRQGKVFTTSSADGGKSWGPMTLINALPNPSSGTDAVTLKDGRHLLVYNPVRKGRTPLAVAVSRDGRDWRQVIVLEDQPGEYSYPAVIQTSDGLVHVTYTWKRQRIRHAVLNPKKIP